LLATLVGAAILQYCREENALADELSNLAMDSDAAVDKVVQRWSQGAGRAELAALLAAGAQVDGTVRYTRAYALDRCSCLLQDKQHKSQQIGHETCI
jgi:hypothetical protein